MTRATDVEEEGLDKKVSSWVPAAASSIRIDNEQVPTASATQKDKTSGCPYLEQLMFPKYLSLDCNKLDEFCMGRVTDASNAGRIYMEALHLKDFLKDADTLTKEYNKKGKNKRASSSTSSPKKKIRGADVKDVADEKALSQTVWGGMEGKRAWMLSNCERGIAGKSLLGSNQEKDPVLKELLEKKALLGAESSDEVLEILLNSELRLRSLQKTFKLHDKTVMFDSYVCNTSDDVLPPQHDAMKVLEDLTKSLPGIKERKTEVNGKDDEKKSSEKSKSLLVPSPVPREESESTATNELTSPSQKVKEKEEEEAARDQVVDTGSAKPHQTSEHQTGLPSQPSETTLPIESDVKAAVTAPPSTTLPDNSKESHAQLSSEEKNGGTQSVENPNNKNSASSTPISLKGDSEKEIGVAAKEDNDAVKNASEQQQHQKVSAYFLDDAEAEETAEALHKRAILEGKEASLAANRMLSSFRQNRQLFWSAKNKSVMKCMWCSPGGNACTKSARTFGLIQDKQEEDHHENVACASGDDLIQCLECNLVGCRSKNHVMLHFLMSGHKYGVTCGEAGELFSVRLGDMVQQECFDRERERVFLEQNLSQFCWQASPINRGINPSSFIVTKEQGYVWRGLKTSYPIPATPQFVRIGHSALKRSLIFRGCFTSKMVALGPSALRLAKYQKSHSNDRLIPTPVGLYNLGNTCYMNSTLQCLIHCVPFQDAFLKELTHPYQCCAALKGGEGSRLASEIDKLLLEHFGSSIGIDAIAALEENENASYSAIDVDADCSTHIEPSPDSRGHPVIPSNFLAEVWKNSAVRHLARHDQHDAQEFYHAFIDGLETDVLSYQKLLSKARNEIKYKSQIQPQFIESPPQQSIKSIFEGSLRSVLICNQCGCKRSQVETFLNLSLPMTNDSSSQPAVLSGVNTKASNIDACLKHFTDPETLSDSIYCPSCNKKTTTLKQNTFAKLPRVLCLHLKRFDAANNKKISDYVSYPASNLDMGKYLPHWCEKIISTESKEKVSNLIDAESPKALYNLFATVNHRGSLNQGHYTSNIKCGDHWYHCNDQFVCHAGEGKGEKEVLEAEGAYMLFYLRRGGT